MNIRQYSIALLISALPIIAFGHPSIQFNEGDFKSGKQVTRNGQTVLNLKLSKSGKAKIKKLNKMYEEEEVQTNLAGIESNFQLKAPIKGDGLELGPFSTNDAKQILEKFKE